MQRRCDESLTYLLSILQGGMVMGEVIVKELCILGPRPAGDLSSHYQLTVNTPDHIFYSSGSMKKQLIVYWLLTSLMLMSFQAAAGSLCLSLACGGSSFAHTHKICSRFTMKLRALGYSMTFLMFSFSR